MERYLRSKECVPDNEVWVSPATFEQPFLPAGDFGSLQNNNQQLKAETLRCKECERYFEGPGLKSPYCYECKWLPDNVDHFIQRKASAV